MDERLTGHAGQRAPGWSRRSVLALLGSAAAGGVGNLGWPTSVTARRHQPHAPRPGSPASCAAAEAAAMLQLVNAWRAAHGAGPLVLDGVLTSAASAKSAALARTGELAHTIDGVSAKDNLRAAGYPVGTAAWGENLAWGQATVHDAFAWWQASPPHNADMLNPRFVAFGLGVARVAGTPYGTYWTQTFGAQSVVAIGAC